MTTFREWKDDLEYRCAMHCAAAVLDEPVVEQTRAREGAGSRRVATMVADDGGLPGHPRGAMCIGITDLGTWWDAKVPMMRIYWKFANGKERVEDCVATVLPGTRLNKVIRLLGLKPEPPFESTLMIGRKTSRVMKPSEFGELLPVPVKDPQFTRPYKMV